MTLGIDFGSNKIVVAAVGRGGVDVVLDGSALRHSANMLAFTDRERVWGNPAAIQRRSNIKRTISSISRLVGRRTTDPGFDVERSFCPYSIVETDDRKAAVQVRIRNETKTYLPEQIMAMHLVQIKKMAQAAGHNVSDVCIAVPVYFNDEQRQLVRAACKIAGLNCLRVLNETTAAVLAYTLKKHASLPIASENQPAQHFVFADVGYADTQLALAKVSQGNCQIISVASGEFLGGRDFDALLVKHFADDFFKKTGLNVFENPKAVLRLSTECDKIKKVLSANTEVSVHMEALMEDTDYDSSITRDQFEEMARPLLEKVAETCASLVPNGFEHKIDGVVGIGGASRIPSVANVLSHSFGHDSVLRTLNPEDDISTGAAYQAAMLSPLFKVRDVTVVDLGVPKAVTLNYPNTNDELQAVEMFPAHCQAPLTRKLNVTRKPAPFNIGLAYPDQPIATWRIEGFPSHLSANEDYKMKIHVKMSGDLLVEPGKCFVTETTTVDVEVPDDTPAESESMEEVSATTPSPEVPAKDPNATEVADPNGAPMEESQDSEQKEGEKEKTEKPKEKKTKIVQQKRQVQHRLAVVEVSGFSVTQDVISTAQQEEQFLQQKDAEFIEATEAKVKLESFVYEARSALNDSLSHFIEQSDAQKVLSQLNELEDWLYDDGFDCPKTVYESKLSQVRGPVDKARYRYNQHQSRPSALETLQHSIQKYSELVATKDSPAPEYDHLEAADWKSVEKEIKSVSKSLAKYKESVQGLPLVQDPPITVDDILKRLTEFETAVMKVLNKPKPKKEEEKKEENKGEAGKKEEEKKEENKGEEAMES
ncbi:hypothetical protein P9112_004511 [Eukaryota sp. TZLM1-RC]